MAATKDPINPFSIKDCAIIAIATGKRARNLGELKNLLNTIAADSIYYHFWGGLLRPRFDDPEDHNDFAYWIRHALHEKILSERLSLIDPTDFSNLEELRRELVEVIDERLDELEAFPVAKHDGQFEFIRSQIVIFDTHQQIEHPRNFVKILPTMSVGSVFYHFIDARRRNDNGSDDFGNWIGDLGEGFRDLRESIRAIDPYFSTLTELRSILVRTFETFFRKGSR